MWLNNILETIGNTPLIRLNKVAKDIPATVLAKVDYFNPGNSIKDRMALKMVEVAEQEGKLKPGGTIIEGTSGNTGMGLALAACVKGYHCIFVTTDKQSKEKVDILKAMGAKNWSIRKIFLYQAAYLIAKGLFYGNLIGLSLCWLQSTFGIITLDPEIYYIEKVPIELTFFSWLIINLITFFVCIVSLILPSFVVTRISPTKAIRFN